MVKVADLTRRHWQGSRQHSGSFRSYDDRIPIVATALELPREHGPAGPAFWMYLGLCPVRRECVHGVAGQTGI